MEPRIQYAKTEDGVDIAYYEMGEGPALLCVPEIFGNVQMEWQISHRRTWWEQLAEKRRLVRYDRRGFGLSERDVTKYSLDTEFLDLEAVADDLGLREFALWCQGEPGRFGLAYAVRHPERVTNLLLWHVRPRASESGGQPRVKAVDPLMDDDWDF